MVWKAFKPIHSKKEILKQEPDTLIEAAKGIKRILIDEVSNFISSSRRRK